jgi:dienelactone hydrolase/predicted small lipoprotein YifL
MRTRAAALALVALLLLLAGCGRAGRVAARRDDRTTTATTATTAPAATSAPASEGTGRYAVGIRRLTLTDASRTTDPTSRRSGDEVPGRTLPTTVWYPAAGDPSAAPTDDAPAASGPFPVVLFSHGLGGLPGNYHALASHWSAAGFVVVAPAYPLTSRDAPRLAPGDVRNQPADAAFVLTEMLRRSAEPDDPFSGLLDGDHVAAAGHSAGAVTTLGLFGSCCREQRLSAGIVLAGNSLGFGEELEGGAAPMLFEHGDEDRVVPCRSGRRAFDAVPWPKAFVTLLGQGHIEPYLRPGDAAFAVVAKTTTYFLSWTLDGDQQALEALRRDAATAGRSSFDDAL